MTRSPSESLAAEMHTFRAAAFALPYRDWAALPEHTREQWRRIADRLAPKLPDVTGKECFDAWAHDMNATWETQSRWTQIWWSWMALILRQAPKQAA